MGGAESTMPAQIPADGGQGKARAETYHHAGGRQMARPPRTNVRLDRMQSDAYTQARDLLTNGSHGRSLTGAETERLRQSLVFDAHARCHNVIEAAEKARNQEYWQRESSSGGGTRTPRSAVYAPTFLRIQATSDLSNLAPEDRKRIMSYASLANNHDQSKQALLDALEECRRNYRQYMSEMEALERGVQENRQNCEPGEAPNAVEDAFVSIRAQALVSSINSCERQVTMLSEQISKLSQMEATISQARTRSIISTQLAPVLHETNKAKMEGVFDDPEAVSSELSKLHTGLRQQSSSSQTVATPEDMIAQVDTAQFFVKHRKRFGNLCSLIPKAEEYVHRAEQQERAAEEEEEESPYYEEYSDPEAEGEGEEVWEDDYMAEAVSRREPAAEGEEAPRRTAPLRQLASPAAY